MASWKKVIVSGSSAELSALTLDTQLAVAQGGTNATTLTDKAVLISQDSGTDTVNSLALTGNGEIIVGGTGGPAVESAADVAGTGLDASTGDGTLAINVAAAQTSITSVINSSLGKIGTAADQEYITFGTSNEVNTFINNTERLSVTANGIDVTGTITNNGAVADSHITGSFTGSFVGDGTGLSGTGLDIDSLSALGGTGLHQTQDHFVFSDNGTEKKITFSNLEDAIFGNVGTDATIAAGGALTIANDAVDNNKLANIARGSVKVGGGSNAPTDLDAKGDGKILVGDGTDINSVAVSGDVALANDGAVTIQANAVEGSMLNSNVAGTGLDYGSNELSVDVSDFMTNGSNNRVLTATGTDGQNAEANLTFDGSTLALTGALTVSTNATITGNLTVNGSTTAISSSNLLIADRFALFNSGSGATGDGGFLIGSGSAGSGSAFIFDDSKDRFGVQIDTQLAQDATTSTPEAYSSLLVLNAHTGSSTYTQNGNMRIDDSGDIFIYVE